MTAAAYRNVPRDSPPKIRRESGENREWANLQYITKKS